MKMLMKNCINYLVCIFILLVSIMVSSCTKSDTANTEKASKPRFVISDLLMKSIKLEPARYEIEQNELELTGKISFNEDKVVRVYPLVGGTVEEIHVELGDYVKKGQVLAELKSTEVAQIEQDLIAAESNLKIAEKNESVLSDMAKSGLSSEKDVLTSKKELDKARAELAKVKRVISIYSINGRSNYIVKAPISGFIVEKNVTNDMQLRSDNSINMFTISDLAKVWVVANVYESDITKIQLGYNAEISTLSYPDTLFKGTVDKIYNVLDPASKVMKIRIMMDNTSLKLKPEMFATVRVRHTGTEKLMAIPAKAVVFDNSRNYVLVFKSQSHVEVHEVLVNKTYKDVAYIQEGSIKVGDQIVSRQQLLLYNALQQ